MVSLNPYVELVRKNWRLVFALVLIAGNVVFYERWQSVKKEYVAYGAAVIAVGRGAQEEKTRIETLAKKNLEVAKNEWEAKLPEIRSGAVDAYRAAHGSMQRGACQSAVPSTAAGQQAHDGTGKEPVPVESCALDEQFIRDAADDAAKVEEWRMYCLLNHCPIEQ